MKVLKKIGHWILFLIGGYFGTSIALAIAILLPSFVGIWLISFGDFWFFILGFVFEYLYYILILGGFSLGVTFLNKKKPDYWISNIFLVIVTFHFFYVLITRFGTFVTENIEVFLNFKGIVLLITLLPAYLQILFVALILPFIKED